MEEKLIDYIDLEEFERCIRMDERKRIQRMIKNRIKNKLELLIQKGIGIFVIILSIIGVMGGWFYEPDIQSNDCTVLLLIIPLALFMIFTNKKVLEF